MKNHNRSKLSLVVAMMALCAVVAALSFGYVSAQSQFVTPGFTAPAPVVPQPVAPGPADEGPEMPYPVQPTVPQTYEELMAAIRNAL